MKIPELNDAERLSVDVTSVGVLIGALAQWLPPAAAALTLIWTMLRIAETQVFAYAWARVFGRRPPWLKD